MLRYAPLITMHKKLYEKSLPKLLPLLSRMKQSQSFSDLRDLRGVQPAEMRRQSCCGVNRREVGERKILKAVDAKSSSLQ
jgi:hypothetical protein